MYWSEDIVAFSNLNATHELLVKGLKIDVTDFIDDKITKDENKLTVILKSDSNDCSEETKDSPFLCANVIATEPLLP